ncbi:MAG: hypothetical protein AAB363_05580 [Planctomycetota bacterium]
MKRVVIALLALLAVLHQDFWYWDSIEPLIFGFIPVGLAYHIGVSMAAGILWAMAVCYCWPKEVDVPDDPFTTQTSTLQSERPH